MASVANMIPAVSARLRRVLEARRESWNGQVARRGAAISAGAMLGYLRRTVDPILVALGEDASDASVDAVALALFTLAMPAISMQMIGEQAQTSFEQALVTHLPRLGVHLRGGARRVVPAVANGYLRVWRERDEPTAERWLERLALAAPRAATQEQLFESGVVLAWRAGLAEARSAALRHLAGMPIPLREALTGVVEIDPDPLRRFAALGSRAQLGPLALIGRAGAFTGFGGDFAVPPLVRAVGGHVMATDGVCVRTLHADLFGMRLRPTTMPVADVLAAGGGADVLVANPFGTVCWAGLEASDDALRGATSVAAADGVVAVTVADSHAVLVLGRREAAA